MITNKVIQFFGQILTWFVSLIPDAPVATGGFATGLAAGTTCCAQVIVGTVASILSTANGGSVAGLANHTPIPVLVDTYWIGFAIGCLIAITMAFFVVKILLLFWSIIKL